jgi:hypothetical protein
MIWDPPFPTSLSNFPALIPPFPWLPHTIVITTISYYHLPLNPLENQTEVIYSTQHLNTERKTHHIQSSPFFLIPIRKLFKGFNT